MKKTVSYILVLVLLCCLFAVPASAYDNGVIEKVSSSTDYYDDGSYCVKEIYRTVPSGDSVNGTLIPTDGVAVMTYYTGSGHACWAVSVRGYFYYEYGVYAYASSAQASVTLYDSNCTFISKSANVYGATASASATVRYLLAYTDKTVTLTCDEYGNLS